jgi:GxxExxY protein
MSRANLEGHEEYEGHEAVRTGGESADGARREGHYSIRVKSPLTPAAERVMTETIGCAIAVHRELGAGFLEAIYRKAMCVELRLTGLAFETERPVHVTYRGTTIKGQRVDLIIEGLVVVEIKSVVRLDDVHRAQLISYLRTTGLRDGLLINFRVPVLQRGLKRVVL